MTDPHDGFEPERAKGLETMTTAALAFPTDAQVDAGAEALRQFEQGGRILRTWSDLPNHDKRKWRQKANAVLRAALAKAIGGR